jgi:hypothetical protein
MNTRTEEIPISQITREAIKSIGEELAKFSVAEAFTKRCYRRSPVGGMGCALDPSPAMKRKNSPTRSGLEAHVSAPVSASRKRRSMKVTDFACRQMVAPIA